VADLHPADHRRALGDARAQGASWSTFGIGIHGATVMEITTFHGQLVVGGDFDSVQGENADYVARWDGTRWQLSSALETAPALFVLGFQRADQPLLGGTLLPTPDAILFTLTDAIGTASLQVPWPGFAGMQIFVQAWVVDAAGPQGVTASQGIWLRAP
jgi:hypothetical protein